MNIARASLIAVMMLPSVADTGRSAQATEPRPAASHSETGKPGAARLASSQWQAGTHYDLIEPAAEPVDMGKVQIIEFFWYGCVHCYALESHLVQWNNRIPNYIEFVRMPSQGRPVSKAHARLYYTLNTLHRSDLHAEVFASIHQQGSKLHAADEAATLRLQLQFAIQHGIAAESFIAAYQSTDVIAALERADRLQRRFRITGIPTFVVNGRYLTSLGRAETPERLFAIVDDLAAREKPR